MLSQCSLWNSFIDLRIVISKTSFRVLQKTRSCSIIYLPQAVLWPLRLCPLIATSQGKVLSLTQAFVDQLNTEPNNIRFRHACLFTADFEHFYVIVRHSDSRLVRLWVIRRPSHFGRHWITSFVSPLVCYHLVTHKSIPSVVFFNFAEAGSP